jgi:hypothetical protein
MEYISTKIHRLPIPPRRTINSPPPKKTKAQKEKQIAVLPLQVAKRLHG